MCGNLYFNFQQYFYHNIVINIIFEFTGQNTTINALNILKKRLPPGIHQYKFIIDGEWRFSPEDSQTTDENGNINNIIDTTDYKGNENDYIQESHQRPVPPIEQRARDRKGTSIEDSDFDKLSISGTPFSNKKKPEQYEQQAQRNPFELQNEKYGLQNTSTRSTALPEFSFKDKAPICPPHLKDIYFLSQKEQKHINQWRQSKVNEKLTQEEIEKKKRIERNEILINFFDSEHSLAPPQHVTTYTFIFQNFLKQLNQILLPD